jgi:chorismate mutase
LNLSKQLAKLRTEIEAIDAELLDIVAKRFKTVIEIGRVKILMQEPSLQKSRWKQVLKLQVMRAQSLGLKPEFVKSIYKLIHKEALRIQNSQMKKQKGRSKK